ncbi:MAG: sulfite exporter TauE/SafE family protein [Deltaproteobacteria bacterium]|nr:sulfite exporter TauE/SafE family protein [Deltaproteobacteria bacterium]
MGFFEIVGHTGFWIAAPVALLAGFMRGFVGVGSGMLMAPVFAILFGPLQTVGMIIMLDALVTAQLLPYVRRLIEWRVIVPMGVMAALCMPVGTWLLLTVDAQSMTRAIAVVVLVFVMLLMTGWRYHGPKRLGITLGVGCLSGVLIAATSMGNPPVIVYFLSGSDSAATNRANFTGYFAISLATLIVMMTVRGLIGAPTLIRTALLLPLFAGGAWLGARYFHKATDRRYRQVALGLLLCVAVYGLLR